MNPNWGARIAQSVVLGSLSCVMQRRGFDPPLSLRYRGFFFPPWSKHCFCLHSTKTLSGKSVNPGLVCAHMHSIARTQKTLTLCPRQVNAGNKNVPSIHNQRRRNVTTPMVGLRNGHIRKNLTKNGEPQRYSSGTLKRKKKKKINAV